jgi:hypothetical protein
MISYMLVILKREDYLLLLTVLQHCQNKRMTQSCLKNFTSPVPEIIDPVFAKTSQNARFLLSENERFGLVFVKTGSINSGTGL